MSIRGIEFSWFKKHGVKLCCHDAAFRRELDLCTQTTDQQRVVSYKYKIKLFQYNESSSSSSSSNVATESSQQQQQQQSSFFRDPVHIHVDERPLLSGTIQKARIDKTFCVKLLKGVLSPMELMNVFDTCPLSCCCSRAVFFPATHFTVYHDHYSCSGEIHCFPLCPDPYCTLRIVHEHEKMLDSGEIEDPIQQCAGCFSQEDQAHRHKLCSKCRSVFYCSRECQLLDWNNGHKQACRRFCAAANTTQTTTTTMP